MLQLVARDKNVQLGPENLGIWGQKVSFMFWNCAFCQQGIPVHPGLQLSHSVSKLLVIFRGSPWFLAVSGHSHFAIISTLNFGPLSTKLGGTVRAIKKMTHNNHRTGPCWIYGKRPILRSAKKRFFAQNPFFPPKNTRNLLDWYLFGNWVLFCLHNFSQSWLEYLVH